jgi:imidazolonepropionase-like amidohydrolase
MAVLIQGSKIKALGPQSEISLPEGSNHEIFDFPQSTLMPGLIDCHTHTNMPGDGRKGEDVDLNDDDDMRVSRSRDNVVTALQTGVTTLCDCGGWNKTTFMVKEEVQKGRIHGSRILASGRPITIRKGHCWFMGSEAEGVEEVSKEARRLIEEGADFLKVMSTGGSTQGTDPFNPAFSSQELLKIVEEGHAQDRVVAAHCRTNAAMRMVVDTGFDVIMHGWFTDSTGTRAFDQALANHIAEHGVRVNPTLHITRSRLVLLRAKKELHELTQEENAQLERMEYGYHENLLNVGRLVRAGVKIMAGSDCGWGIYPFGRFDLELQAMVEAGLSPIEVIVAATSGNAEALKIADQVGTIDPEKEADLIVVNGAPDMNITDIANVLVTFKGGQILQQSTR